MSDGALWREASTTRDAVTARRRRAARMTESRPDPSTKVRTVRWDGEPVGTMTPKGYRGGYVYTYQSYVVEVRDERREATGIEEARQVAQQMCEEMALQTPMKRGDANG